VCDKISIKVNSEFNTLDEILLWFEQLNHPPISEPVIWWQCQTLLQEGFANVVQGKRTSNAIENWVLGVDWVRAEQMQAA
jgi:serine/threonine-protein kinase RsbW